MGFVGENHALNKARLMNLFFANISCILVHELALVHLSLQERDLIRSTLCLQGTQFFDKIEIEGENIVTLQNKLKRNSHFRK